MLRTPNSPYKQGRSTLKEGWLLKVKRFKDSEAEIIGFEEQMENTNEKTKDELGHSKRSSHKAGMVGKGTLGKFLVREIGSTPWFGREFAIGTGEGLTNELRQEIWDNRDKHLGKILTYKYQVHGIKELPRLPISKGFRDERDMS
jgi:DNA ligase-1